MKLGRGEHKFAKKQSLRWKSRTLLFRSPSWKFEKERKIKSRLLIFRRLSAKKESADNYHVIRKSKSGF
jgi:hypothetical protein